MMTCIVLAAGGAWAQQLSIMVEGQGFASGCRYFEFSPFVSIHGWILAHPASGSGVLGAEFMVQLPPNVIVLSVTPNTAVTASGGSPFAGPTGGGAWVLFDACQPPPTSQPVILYEFTLLSVGAWGLFELPILRATQPTNPTFNCPVLLDCESQYACATQGYGGGYIGPAFEPFPADQAVDVPASVDLTWTNGPIEACGCLGVPSTGMYFGTQPDPPGVFGNEPFETYDPGPLLPGTTYYWRVDTWWCGGYATSPVWSFTTSATVLVEHKTWGTVKRLYN